MKRLFHHLAFTLSTLLAAATLTIVPAASAAHHVSAMSMDHAGMFAATPTAMTSCPQPVSTGVIPDESEVGGQEQVSPDPLPVMAAAYRQPQISPQPKAIKPKGVYADGLLRPPDVLEQAGILRL